MRINQARITGRHENRDRARAKGSTSTLADSIELLQLFYGRAHAHSGEEGSIKPSINMPLPFARSATRREKFSLADEWQALSINSYSIQGSAREDDDDDDEKKENSARRLLPDWG